MASSEKVFPSPKSYIDDTEKIVCTVETAQNINKHTEYILRVERGPTTDVQWHISRRYRDFATLHMAIQQANIELPLPPKRLIGNMHPSFIAERQIALQNYLTEILKHQILALSLPVRSFLDPKNYSLSIAEQALQTVSIALRGNGKYDLKGPMPDIGWRIRKQYFMVTDSNKTNRLLSWQTYGPDRTLSDKDLQATFKSLINLSHPFIDQILAIQNLESGAYVVRKVHENGCLRDILYGTEYNKDYLAKYGNPRVRKPFTSGQIAHYGYQILHALKFLHEKGLPHGHIHSGNIAIVNQRALLLDIENLVMGVSSLYRPYLLDLRRTTAEAMDVYCFGRLLYEMAFASPLEQYYCDLYPYEIGQGLESVLQLCLSSSSCKHGGPTIDHLLSHPFFARAPLNGLTSLTRDELRGHLKFPLLLKEELKAAIAYIEARLKNEQKLVRNVKKEVRLREILSSDEELKKQKRRAKKRDSIWKSSSSLAETVRSQSVSTASSPTPPALPPDVSGNGSTSPVGPSTCNGRSALLDAICAFDKKKLARVTSR